MRIIAIIPARGGSKGLPKKNILELFGKPLIAWSIEASLKSQYITKTIVSSDCDEILNISSQYGAETLKRPEELALDTSPTEPVIKHVLDNLNEYEKFDYIILLQATSPLRDETIIDNAFEHLFNNNAAALISVNEIDNKILKAFKLNTNGYLEGISNNIFPFSRRQDLPKVFMPNGAIYIIKTEDFLKSNRLFTSKTIHFLMDENKSYDIDTIDDLKKCDEILKEIKGKK